MTKTATTASKCYKCCTAADTAAAAALGFAGTDWIMDNAASKAVAANARKVLRTMTCEH